MPTGSWDEQKPRDSVVHAGKAWTARWNIVPLEVGKLQIHVKLISTLRPPVTVEQILNVVVRSTIFFATKDSPHAITSANLDFHSFINGQLLSDHIYVGWEF